MHADRTNRVMLLLLAVLLIAAGARRRGRIHRRVRDRHPAQPPDRQPGRAPSSAPRAAGSGPSPQAAAVILALLALRWLLALLFSTDRSGDLLIPPGGPGGPHHPRHRGPDRSGSRGDRKLPGRELRPRPSPRRPRRPRTRRHRGAGGNRRLRRAAPAHRNRRTHPRPRRGRQPIAAHPAGPDRHHETFHPGRLKTGAARTTIRRRHPR